MQILSGVARQPHVSAPQAVQDVLRQRADFAVVNQEMARADRHPRMMLLVPGYLA